MIAVNGRGTQAAGSGARAWPGGCSVTQDYARHCPAAAPSPAAEKSLLAFHQAQM